MYYDQRLICCKEWKYIDGKFAVVNEYASKVSLNDLVNEKLSWDGHAFAVLLDGIINSNYVDVIKTLQWRQIDTALAHMEALKLCDSVLTYMSVHDEIFIQMTNEFNGFAEIESQIINCSSQRCKAALVHHINVRVVKRHLLLEELCTNFAHFNPHLQPSASCFKLMIHQCLALTGSTAGGIKLQDMTMIPSLNAIIKRMGSDSVHAFLAILGTQLSKIGDDFWSSGFDTLLHAQLKCVFNLYPESVTTLMATATNKSRLSNIILTSFLVNQHDTAWMHAFIAFQQSHNNVVEMLNVFKFLMNENVSKHPRLKWSILQLISAHKDALLLNKTMVTMFMDWLLVVHCDATAENVWKSMIHSFNTKQKFQHSLCITEWMSVGSYCGTNEMPGYMQQWWHDCNQFPCWYSL